MNDLQTQSKGAHLNLKNVSKVFHNRMLHYEALKNISFEIAAGQYVGIWGPSGSGKSTLMTIMGCLSTPTSGSYLLDDIEVSNLPSRELARVRNQKIGFIFQNFNLLPHLDIIDNVALPLAYRNVDHKIRRELAEGILRSLGLGQHFKHKPDELSGGEQQRVAIARALITKPKLILADEPTGNLDSYSGEQVIKLLSQASKEGATVITVTHDRSLALQAERIICLRDGRLVECPTIEEICHI